MPFQLLGNDLSKHRGDACKGGPPLHLHSRDNADSEPAVEQLLVDARQDVQVSSPIVSDVINPVDTLVTLKAEHATTPTHPRTHAEPGVSTVCLLQVTNEGRGAGARRTRAVVVVEVANGCAGAAP